jgi:predicted RNA-binding Zn-ribbon protein involved in translation (DUF1610 family)
MREDVFLKVATVLIVVQVAFPLAVGGPLLPSWMRPARLHRNATRASAAASGAPPGPRLAALVCTVCSAPVPLLAASFPCPHCGAQVSPPDDYVRAIAARGAFDEELARAERIWRWSRWSTARPTLIVARTAIVVWGLFVFASIIAVSDRGWPKSVLFVAGILIAVELIMGFAFASMLDGVRRQMPPLPAASAFRCKAEITSCTSCGAPMRFAEDRVACPCLYCGADCYRAGAASIARQDAEDARGKASASLLDAVRARDERFSDFQGYVVFLAIAEVFYTVFFGLVWIYSLIFG